MTSLNSLHARVGAHGKWARVTDRTAATAPARAASPADLGYWLAKTDATLSESARLAQAESMQKLHFSQMAYRSAQARRRNARQRAAERAERLARAAAKAEAQLASEAGEAA